MEAYQERVIAEKRELDEKIGKLTIFLDGRTVAQLGGDVSTMQLLRQRRIMREYSEVLGERIAAFPQSPAGNNS